MPSFTPQALHALTTLIVSRMGSAPDETAQVADHLVRANLAGHDSHGVGMLPAYIRLLREGMLVPNPDGADRARCRRAAGDRLMIPAEEAFRCSRLNTPLGGTRLT